MRGGGGEIRRGRWMSLRNAVNQSSKRQSHSFLSFVSLYDSGQEAKSSTSQHPLHPGWSCDMSKVKVLGVGEKRKGTYCEYIKDMMD